MPNLHIDEFNFSLPQELIAEKPVTPRDASRLFVINRTSGLRTHTTFANLSQFLDKGDCLVLNNSKVIPARLIGELEGGREIEVFLTNEISPGLWSCLVKPGRKIKNPTAVSFEGNTEALVSRKGEGFHVRFNLSELDFWPWIERHGLTPLPPYIKRRADTDDKERYQTVYAKPRGSVAAPTAGLHFTDSLLDQIREKGIEIVYVTLHVGLGTFSPIKADRISDHKMHAERFSLSPESAQKIEACRSNGGRVFPVGTTSFRVLESYSPGQLEGETKLFVAPGYHPKRADGLITNFHLPKSSLFVLVAGLLGCPTAQACYAEAIEQKYRFYSYGDAMLII